ncbi:MAG: tetratricopeptide repeat protein [Acidobacteriota bacterium]
MPEPTTTTILGLRMVAPILVKLVPWAWKSLPSNSAVAKAIRATAERYLTRLPGIGPALETWVLSDAFGAHVESVESGALVDAEVVHVELFLKTTGYGRGVSSLENITEALVFFYTELSGQLLDGEHGMRIIGAKLDTIHREMLDQRRPRPGPDLEALPYRPTIETEATSHAASEADRKAEVQLDLIKTLIDKRQASTALRLLEALQDPVNRGLVSPAIRFRFFVNKGVCLMLEGDWDQAEAEFNRAQTLEPTNRKALINLAQIARLRDKQEEALQWLKPVLSQDSDDSSANALRFACLHELNRDSEVQALLNAQPTLANDSDVLYTLGYIAHDQQKFDEAEHYLRRHNELDANRPEAWELLGRAILMPAQRQLQRTAASPNWIPDEVRARIEEAEAFFSKAEQLLVGSESRRELKYTLVNRGVARTLLGRYDDARQDHEYALRLDPSMEGVKRNLGSLYLHTERPDEAVRCFEQIHSPELKAEVVPLLAGAYLNLNKPADARVLLESMVGSSQGEDRLIVKDLLLIACQRLKDAAACDELLSSLASIPDDPEAHRIIAEYYSREGDFDKAVASARSAVERAGVQQAARYRVQLGDILYRAKRFDEAADTYQLVPVPLDDSPESRRRLIALFNAGRMGKALQVAQGVRNGGPAVPEFSEIEALIYERTGDLDSANRLRTELMRTGASPERQKLKMALNHFRQGKEVEATELTLQVGLDSIVADSESIQDAAMLRTLLRLPDALVFAYRLLQEEPNSPEIHLFYVNTFLRREEVDKDLFHPDVVAADCVVTLRHGAENQTLTVVDGESDTAKDWLSTGHPLAVQMFGRRIGDRFRFPEGGPFESEYEIQAVQSKYVRAFQDCMGRFAERFPAHYGLARIEVEDDDITKIVVMLDRQRTRAELILDIYRRGKLPACAAARLFGKSEVEMFRAFIEDRRIKILSYHGTLERMAEEEQILSKTKRVLLETSAFVTLQSLGLLTKLAGAFDAIHVTQQQIDALTEAMMNLFPEKHTGYLLSDTPGHIQVFNRTSEEVTREREFYQQLLDFTRMKCQVVAPGGQMALEEIGKLEIQEILGTVALSTLSTAVDSGLVMVSDDLPLRVLAQSSYSLSNVGSLSVLRHLRARSVISESEYHESVQWLVDRGFSFVSITKDDLVWVLKKNHWSPTAEVAAFLQALAGPDYNAEDAISIGLEVLNELWNEPLLSVTRQLTSDLLLSVLITGRDRQQVLRRLELMNRRRFAIWTPATAQIQEVIRSWRPRRWNRN